MKREMKDSFPKPDPSGLAEFETASSAALAPFEEEGSTLLDEFTEASPNLLDEFEASLDTVFSIEPVPSEPDEGENAEAPESGDKEGEAAKPDESVEKAGETAEEVLPREEMTERIPSEEEEEPVIPERGAVPQPANPVIGFACRYAVDLSSIMDAHGRMIGRNTVHFIEMPCAGMVKPKWLKYVLDKGASGAFVVSCFPGSCHHRRGACVFHGRWEGSRDPALDRHVSQSRIRLFEGHLAARDDLLRRLEEFLQKIANMDASLQTRETTQNEPPVPVEETEDPM